MEEIHFSTMQIQCPICGEKQCINFVDGGEELLVMPSVYMGRKIKDNVSQREAKKVLYDWMMKHFELKQSSSKNVEAT